MGPTTHWVVSRARPPARLPVRLILAGLTGPGHLAAFRAVNRARPVLVAPGYVRACARHMRADRSRMVLAIARNARACI
jgi:hypothetical protein